MKVRPVCILLALGLTLQILAVEKPAYVDSEGFFVVGRRIYNPDGSEFIMRGINHNHSWGDENISLNSMPEINKADPNIVRCVFWNETWPQHWGGTPEGRRSIVEQYIGMDVVPMVEFHEGTCENDSSFIKAMVDHWLEPGNMAFLQDYEEYVILNIANEWGPGDDPAYWADTYKRAITRLRDAGINNMIVLDSPGCGQSPVAMQAHGQELIDHDPQHNLVLSIHFYGNWRTLDDYSGVTGYGSPWGVENELGNMVDLNLPVIVGEFSWQEFESVPYATELVLKYCEDNDIGWLAWSWNMNGDPLLDMVDGYLYEDLNEYGELIVNHPRYGLKATSDRATGFGPQNQRPVVTITGPSDSSNYNPYETVQVTVDANDPDGEVETVRLYNGSTLLGEDSDAPYEFSVSTLYRGWYTLYASAWDDSGHIGSSNELHLGVGLRETTKEALFIVGNPNLTTADQAINNRLEVLGFHVNLLEDNNAHVDSTTGMDLVFISITNRHVDIPDDFKAVTVPLINAEPNIMDNLQLTGTTSNTDFGQTQSQTVTIVAEGHPMANGLTGDFDVQVNGSRLVWGKPSESAQVIATLYEEPEKYALFGYETGDEMVGLTAPARRLGIFLYTDTAAKMTLEGWKLFDAAIDWAVDTVSTFVQRFEKSTGASNFRMEQNYPNPFNPTTQIQYDIAEPSHVQVTVYNIHGQKVKTLLNQFQRSGEYAITWDGTNAFNQEVGSGVYIFEILAGEKRLQHKMMLMR
ncbi:cellulase family glycosylhydrolase [candidate division KSB1 bacterium]|nr:cellulase family glycosylhydrolase [candidate division KSB1 bacterium]